jgi:diphosphomevalonate decarboxylase
MPTYSAVAVAHPNIALIKYWGNRDMRLRIPANSSLSMNLDGLLTRTQVTFDPDLKNDVFILDGQPVSGPAAERVSGLLDRVRRLARLRLRAVVNSANNFPTGVGIASSASAFAALSLAASAAAGLQLGERDLSRLARASSGSACRSVPGGFVEWQAGSNDTDSFAYTIAPPDYWDLTDCIAIVSQTHKLIGSSEGHERASTSPIQAARLADTPLRMNICRQAILERDFEALTGVVELDSNLMHAVMMTCTPPLMYTLPATMAVMHAVQAMRKINIPVCYTVDAGPNVHVICLSEFARRVTEHLTLVPGVLRVLAARPGGPARLEG